MKCRIIGVEGKSDEHQLIATEGIKAGELVLKERPLVTVLDREDEEDWMFPWRLTEKILASREIKNLYCDWQLKVTNTAYLSFMLEQEQRLAKKYGLQPSTVRFFYFSVTTNNIGFPGKNGKIGGWGMYKHMCRANHACNPNSVSLSELTEKDLANKVCGLVALRDIAVSEPITWSYAGMSNEFLNADYEKRGQTLFDHFYFACDCARCRAEIPVELVDDRVRLERYWKAFRELVASHNARRKLSSPTVLLADEVRHGSNSR